MPEPSATAAPSATPADLGPPQVELDRIVDHVRVFSQDIGAREAGSVEEDEAVAYAQRLLQQWGYVVEVQAFEAQGPLPLHHTTLTADGREIDAIALGASGPGNVSGRLVDAGTGQDADSTNAADGAVVLIQRQDVFFVDMARRARDAGAAGAIVTNREPGFFVGALDPPVDLPMVSISQEEGAALRDEMADGDVEVAISVDGEAAAENVIARPESGVCRTLSGGHLDSVPWAPGATDNASGSAVVLELARASAAAGIDDACFALFGAEEMGLLGSAFFVGGEERGALEAYYNYDVAAGTSEVRLIGDATLIDAVDLLADEAGIDAGPSQLAENAGSDHLSFIAAGIPALMLTASGPVTIHTPQDSFDNLATDSLADIAGLGFALLRQ
ncbi:MAG: M28 family metallopeptidase [Dehalococcoidia bacterium]